MKQAFIAVVMIWLGATLVQPAVATESNPAVAALKELNLDAARQIALANSPTIKAAQARMAQARQRVRQASAAYWPFLDLNVSARQVKLSDNQYQTNLATARYVNPQATIEDPQDYYRGGLAASWLLFNGFERKFVQAAAQYGEKESQAAFDDAMRLLLAAVAEAYYHAQLARLDIMIAEADEAFFQRQLTDARARRNMGTGSLSDQMNFEIQINTAQTALLEKRRVYDVALYGLAALMGLADAALPAGMQLARLADKTDQDEQAVDVSPCIEYARRHRPDLKLQDFRVQRAQAEVGAARAKYYPSINLAADVAGDRSGSAAVDQDDFGYTVGLYLTYNLFAGGAHQAAVAEARAAQRENQQTLQDREIQVVSQVRQAVRLIQSAQQQLPLQRTSAQLAERNRDLVAKEYAAGQTSLVRLNEAQRDLTAAQSRLALALVGLRLAWQQLQAATAEVLVVAEKK